MLQDKQLGSIFILGIKKCWEKNSNKKSLLSNRAIYYFQKYHQLIKCAIRLISLLFESCVRDSRQILLPIIRKFNSFMMEVPIIKNQSNDFQSKSIDWFLQDRDLRYKIVKNLDNL